MASLSGSSIFTLLFSAGLLVGYLVMAPRYLLGIEGLALPRAGADRRFNRVATRAREIEAIARGLEEQPYSERRDLPESEVGAGYAGWAESYAPADFRIDELKLLNRDRPGILAGPIRSALGPSGPLASETSLGQTAMLVPRPTAPRSYSPRVRFLSDTRAEWTDV